MTLENPFSPASYPLAPKIRPCRTEHGGIGPPSQALRAPCFQKNREACQTCDRGNINHTAGSSRPTSRSQRLVLLGLPHRRARFREGLLTAKIINFCFRCLLFSCQRAAERYRRNHHETLSFATIRRNVTGPTRLVLSHHQDTAKKDVSTHAQTPDRTPKHAGCAALLFSPVPIFRGPAGISSQNTSLRN